MLYLEHRPKTFDDMIGNEAQIAALKKVLEKKNPPHVYLFVGDPGCGKTTAARIAAKVLGASDLTITEINSANNRGIDTAREIIDRIHYLPTGGKANAWIIDELHMTTKEWQNAMLKPLEDTPKHVFFFLCTTDAKKLDNALKTRCTEFKFKNLTPQEISLLLRKVCKAEGFKLDKEVLLELADYSGGSPRRALVTLEKISGLDDTKKQMEIIHSGVAEADEAEAFKLCQILIKATKADWGKMMGIVSGLDKDKLEGVRQLVMSYMGSVLDKNWNPKAMQILEAFAERDFFYDAKSRLKVAIAHSIFTD
jgi:DNA polymerase-3 subunit gamma/tau